MSRAHPRPQPAWHCLGLVVAGLFLSPTAWADDAYARAQAAAAAGDAATAVALLREAQHAGAIDSALYPALGNALYRLPDPVAKPAAAAAWRRGLRLAPRNGDLAANLDRVREGFVDRIDPPPDAPPAFFWQNFLSTRESGALASLFTSLGLGTAIFARFRQRAVGALPPVSLLVGLLLALSTYFAHQNAQTVIVLDPELAVRSALGPDGVELFRLHAGAEVRSLDSSGEHTLIQLPDDRRGWVQSASLLSTDPREPFPTFPTVAQEGTQPAG
jgi:hypothetical protein